jgi:hypothetical protein
VDPDVGVLAVWHPGGRLLGCVVNYACHGTTAPGGISADWVYYLEQTIRASAGREAIVVFLNGACGDVTQVDNRSTSQRESGEKFARIVGTRVGAEVLKVLATAEKGRSARTTALRETLTVERRRPSPASVKEARATVRDCLRTGDTAADWVFAKERLILDHLVRQEPSAQVEVQALQVGPAVFLANPAEYFCALGRRIKAESPFPLTCVVELANGAAGYVPDREAFGPGGGGYETVLTSYSNLEPAAGDLIADASLRLARALRPGRLPQRPRVKAAGSPWNYGIRGPDLD